MVAGSGVSFPVAQRWMERAARSDSWAATRGAILEVDAANLGYPQYVDRAKGAYVWDVDGNRYIDLNLGYGPVVLGHADPRVNAAVIRQLERGVCFSPMWTTAQVELTELLTEVVPGAEQAFLLRTGSDATAAAVRLARLHTGREKVVRWGYNGWHDWCAPRRDGIPTATLDNTILFPYGDLASLETAFAEHPEQIACVIMMTYEYEAPPPGFFQRAKDLAHSHDALFILDEMRSGFRIALGGAQEYFGVVADLSTFSKAMANGYPISAVVGRADVMANQGRTHMSSTYYGNGAEMVAAMTTIGILRDTDAIEHIWRLGERFVHGLSGLVADYEAPARVVGLPISPFLQFDDDSADARTSKVDFYATTLRHGLLLHPNHQWFFSAAHTHEDVEEALFACRAAFEVAMNRSKV